MQSGEVFVPYHWKLLRWVRAVMMLSFVSAVTLALSAPVRVAIVPVGKESRVEVAAVQMLQLVATMPGVETLDRVSVAEVLREKALNAGSSEYYADHIKMALPADVYAFVEPGMIGPKSLRLRVSETRSGAILCDTVVIGESAPGASAPLDMALTNALKKKIELASSGRYLAWLGAGTEEAEGRLGYEATALSVLVGPELLSSPQIALLDRSHLASLGDESHVSGIDQALWTSVVAAETSIRRAGSSSEADISLLVRRGSGAVITSMVSRVTLTNLPAVAQMISENIQTVLVGATRGQGGTPPRTENEAALLSSRAAALASYGEWPRALELAESAYALDRNLGNRLQLAGILANAEPDNPRSLGRAAEVLTEFYYVAGNNRSSPEYLNFLRRSAEVLGEYYYVAGYDRPGWPNNGYHSRNPESATNTSDRSAWQHLLDMEETMFRARLHSCDPLCSPTTTVQKAACQGTGETALEGAYWGTWCDRLEHFESYRPGDPSGQIALLTDVADQYIARMPTNADVFYGAMDTMIATVRQPVLKAVTSTSAGAEAFVGYLHHLHSNKEPFLRMLSYYGAIGMQCLGFQSKLGDLNKPEVDLAIEMLKIMADEMPPEQGCRATVDGNRLLFGLLKGQGLQSGGGAGRYQVMRLFPGFPPQNPVPAPVIQAQYKVFTATFPSNLPPEVLSRRMEGVRILYGDGQDFWPDYFTELVHAGCLDEAASLALAIKPTPASLDRSKIFWRKFLILLAESGRLDAANRLAQMLRPGNDSLAIISGYRVDFVNESPISPKPVVATPSSLMSPPWNRYVLVPLGSFRRPYYHQGFWPGLRAHELLHLMPDGKNLNIVDICDIRDEHGMGVGAHIVRIGLDSGKKYSDKIVKFDASSLDVMCGKVVSDVASDARNTYLATKKGVCVIENDTGITSWIDARSGLPGQDVRTLAVLGSKLYLTVDTPSALVAYDTVKKTMEVLASERSLQMKTEWDGKHIQITDMMADPTRKLIWLRDKTGSDRRGIWRLDPAVGKLDLMAKFGPYRASPQYAKSHGWSNSRISADPVLPSYRRGGSGDWIESLILYNINCAESNSAFQGNAVFDADTRLLVRLPGDTLRAARYKDDVFSLGGKLVLTRDEKTYPFEDDETKRPLGQFADLVATEQGVVFVNSQGSIFLLRERKPGEQQLESWGTESPLDPELARYASGILAGHAIDASQREACRKRFRQCLFNFGWDEADGFYNLANEEFPAFYANVMCMGVIDPANYEQWTLNYRQIASVLAPLKDVLRHHDDPALHAAAILPAVRCSETAFAVTEYQRLTGLDPAWAGHVLKLARQSSDYHDKKFIDTVTAFSVKEQKTIADPYIRDCLTEVMAGHKLSSLQQKTCQDKFKELMKRLDEQAPGEKSYHGMATAVFYVNAICVAAINPDRYGGWPVRYAGKREAFEPLRDMAKDTNDPLLRTAAILAEVSFPKNINDVEGVIQHATNEYYHLRHDCPAWAELILKFLKVPGDGVVSGFYSRVSPL